MELCFALWRMQKTSASIAWLGNVCRSLDVCGPCRVSCDFDPVLCELLCHLEEEKNTSDVFMKKSIIHVSAYLADWALQVGHTINSRKWQQTVKVCLKIISMYFFIFSSSYWELRRNCRLFFVFCSPFAFAHRLRKYLNNLKSSFVKHSIYL